MKRKGRDRESEVGPWVHSIRFYYVRVEEYVCDSMRITPGWSEIT